ncbi:VacJ family lipoprotein [Stenotrophomonas aracearum]|jgi:phospholipid-binding lipoprotein MlaA|uniref:VacJ family lipoprotein n=1 Tax=Stenotrophomonas aracearum TaxID=3003272 RepID=A0ABY9YDG6_9GAMM|nr:VacJ family lipoprotein [Stenotrophomonas sp. A5588]WNH48742.1 VacJ family lipoprotein [Stenotrophomonas sp. A5588]
MNVVRTASLFLLVLALSACAAKPARDSAPATVAVSPVAATDVPAPVADGGAAVPAPAPVAAAAPAVSGSDAAASDAAPTDGTAPAATGAAPTGAEDDFAALYGGPAPNADGAEASTSAYDPWEGFNRRVHAFNNVVDRAIARPLATAYTNVVPRFARTGVSNFFSNLRAPVTITNQLLQGRPGDAWDSLGRFIINTTVGIGGLWDPASAGQVPRRSEDFGQTLGAWGWRSSRYVELPFFGPRTVRDVFGLAGDIPLSPIRTIEQDNIRIPLQGLQLVDMRSQLLALDDIRDNAVDEYALTRDAWLQRRNYQIVNDLRGRRERGKDADDSAPIPVDAMPMPNWGN